MQKKKLHILWAESRARTQRVMEGEVKELDIQRLPTTPTPHWLSFPCTHHQHQCTELLFFLLLQRAKEAATHFVFCSIWTKGPNHVQTNLCNGKKYFILWKECIFLAVQYDISMLSCPLNVAQSCSYSYEKSSAGVRLLLHISTGFYKKSRPVPIAGHVYQRE